MGQSGDSSRTRTFEKRKGLLRRNWPVLAVAPLALLLIGLAFAYWWWLPRYVSQSVASVTDSATRILGAPVEIGDINLVGMDHLLMTEVSVGDPDEPLLRFASVDVEFAPFTFVEGLPTVVLVQVQGVTVTAVRSEDGGDNFSKIAESLSAYLARERSKKGGEASKLARLLRQTPPVKMKDVTFSLALDRDDPALGRQTLVELVHGTVSAQNPNMSLREKSYLVDAEFRVAKGPTLARFAGDLDISKRAFQASADFDPPLPIKLQRQQVAVSSISYRSGEFLEVKLGTIILENPFESFQELRAVATGILGRIGREEWLQHLERAVGLEGWLEDTENSLLKQAARLGYPEAVWAGFTKSLRESAAKTLQAVVAEAEGEYLVLDGARFLYTIGTSASGARTRKFRSTVAMGESGGAEVTISHRVDTGRYDAGFNVTSPSEMLQFSGTAEYDGERFKAKTDFSASLTDPMVQLRGTLFVDQGELTGDVKGQVRLSEPPLAVSTNLLVRNDDVTGEVVAEFVVPKVMQVRQAKLSLQGGGWTAEANGAVYAPDGSGPIDFSVSADSENGVRRFSAVAESAVRVNLGEYDVLLGRVRMGRDSIVHLEDLAVTGKGADLSRALVRIADLALVLSAKGKELVSTASGLQGGWSPQALLRALVKRVEIVEPVVLLRQPPTLSPPAVDDADTSRQDLADKISDALGETSAKAVVMHEPFRTSLSRLVQGTGAAVRAFLKAMLDLGDNFPIEQVEIKEGRFEYSDAVSPQDRLLSELSNFNATITKVSRVGTLGGKFALTADFSTAVANQSAGSSLKAEVNLATGDLTGELKVEKLALFPYRFFLPSMLSPTRLTFLENANLGISYQTETDRFVVWGRGTLSDFNIVSRRISSKPLEHLEVGFTLGEDANSGLVFEIERHRLGTNAPMFFSMGKVNRLALEFSVDAADLEFPKFDMKVRLPELAVNDLLASIPKSLGDRLSGLQVDGTMGFTISLLGDSRDLRGLKFSFNGEEEGLKLGAPGRHADFSKLSGAFKHRPPTDRQHTMLVGTGERYVPLERISPWLILAVTTCEDGSFFRHQGFNTYQIKMSIIRNLEKGRFVRGASTITMQLVKNLFLSHEKTVARKLQEIILTWLVEKEIRKDRLIEIYLNVIEWGEGVYGIREACDFYFGGLPPESISPAQAAFLASFIPYPRPFSTRFKKGFGGERTKRWKRWWGKRLKIVKRIGKAMVNNCSMIDSKCPSRVEFCRIMLGTCRDPGKELRELEHLQDLDDIFRPEEEPVVGELGNPVLEL